MDMKNTITNKDKSFEIANGKINGIRYQKSIKN